MEVPSPPGTGGAGRVWQVAPGRSCPFAGNRTSSASEDVLYGQKDGGGLYIWGMYECIGQRKTQNHVIILKIFFKNSCLEE